MSQDCFLAFYQWVSRAGIISNNFFNPQLRESARQQLASFPWTENWRQGENNISKSSVMPGATVGVASTAAAAITFYRNIRTIVSMWDFLSNCLSGDCDGIAGYCLKIVRTWCTIDNQYLLQTRFVGMPAAFYYYLYLNISAMEESGEYDNCWS